MEFQFALENICGCRGTNIILWCVDRIGIVPHPIQSTATTSTPAATAAVVQSRRTSKFVIQIYVENFEALSSEHIGYMPCLCRLQKKSRHTFILFFFVVPLFAERFIFINMHTTFRYNALGINGIYHRTTSCNFLIFHCSVHTQIVSSDHSMYELT